MNATQFGELSFKLTESGAYVYNALAKFALVIPMCSAEVHRPSS